MSGTQVFPTIECCGVTWTSMHAALRLFLLVPPTRPLPSFPLPIHSQLHESRGVKFRSSSVVARFNAALAASSPSPSARGAAATGRVVAVGSSAVVGSLTVKDLKSGGMSELPADLVVIGGGIIPAVEYLKGEVYQCLGHGREPVPCCYRRLLFALLYCYVFLLLPRCGGGDAAGKSTRRRAGGRMPACSGGRVCSR